MPHWATSSHVWRLYDLVLQARGRRFEPYCAHCFAGQTHAVINEMIVREPKLMVILHAQAM